MSFGNSVLAEQFALPNLLSSNSLHNFRVWAIFFNPGVEFVFLLLSQRILPAPRYSWIEKKKAINFLRLEREYSKHHATILHAIKSNNNLVIFCKCDFVNLYSIIDNY